jgi:hypothetical protein
LEKCKFFGCGKHSAFCAERGALLERLVLALLLLKQHKNKDKNP